jgi:hypothetical protein
MLWIYYRRHLTRVLWHIVDLIGELPSFPDNLENRSTATGSQLRYRISACGLVLVLGSLALTQSLYRRQSPLNSPSN